MPIKEIMRIVFQNKLQADDEKKNAAKADALFAKQSKGRDESEVPIATGEVFMRIQYKFAGPNDDDRQDLAKLPYIINSRMLYFLDEPDSYRGVNSGIDLANVVSITDDCMNGQCCQRIQKVAHVEIPVYDFEGYCFHMDMPTENYLFCLKEQDDIKAFRDKLIASTMSAWFLKQGIEAPNFIEDEGLKCLNPEFNWSEESQQSWPCQCNKGLTQSPIEINPDTVIEKKEDRLKFEWKDAQAIRYGVVRREPEFWADFGQFSHITPEKTVKYEVNHVTFKMMMAEHSVSGPQPNIPRGEMLLYGAGSSGEKAILSVFFITGEADNNPDDKTNKFMDNMNVDAWVNYNFNEMDENDQPVMKCLKYLTEKEDKHKFKYPNMKDMIRSNKQLDGDLSFYFYQGSESKPPCEEKVTRFVLQNPAKIDADNFSKMQKKILVEGKVKPRAERNVRSKQPVFGREVYYHKASLCQVEEPKKKEEPAETNTDYKFVKATQKY